MHRESRHHFRRHHSRPLQHSPQRTKNLEYMYRYMSHIHLCSSPPASRAQTAKSLYEVRIPSVIFSQGSVLVCRLRSSYISAIPYPSRCVRTGSHPKCQGSVELSTACRTRQVHLPCVRPPDVEALLAGSNSAWSRSQRAHSIIAHPTHLDRPHTVTVSFRPPARTRPCLSERTRIVHTRAVKLGRRSGHRRWTLHGY
ncbi:hypothetical protein PYCCODRAFT_1007498 [Trametes coccinea BRFM310]|uniref:Uncharacterized protein n=1 Tax=Trametes coccinea (strain BRFM310) TaxID=1353009 RepID=A0A1Y2IB60_TRAC3|nr:hypothetical protein PYCCODRAFT_1007498 [Trametes coccinea BRFM310]